jgi:hypothetical protein
MSYQSIQKLNTNNSRWWQIQTVIFLEDIFLLGLYIQPDICSLFKNLVPQIIQSKSRSYGDLKSVPWDATRGAPIQIVN